MSTDKPDPQPRKWQEGVCNETSGFLFNHASGKPADTHCDLCDKPISNEHAHQDEQGRTLCTSCMRLALRRQADPGGPRTYAPMPMYYHNPYFFAGYYYPGYGYYGPGHWGHHTYHGAAHGGHAGHDPHDFTAGDAESLSYEGDEGWESDFGDS